MFSKQIRAAFPWLTLAIILAGLSGCGAQSSITGTNSGPDTVQITMHLLVIGGSKQTTVMLTNASMVHQLFTTVAGLADFPANAACTDEAGPSYTLTFLQSSKTLLTLDAQRYGCRVVSIKGETQQKVANAQFWSELDQAIYHATPIAQPQQLAILHTIAPDQPAQSALITSAATAQRLYQAILALSQVPSSSTCIQTLRPEYQLAFHTADQTIPSIVDNTCNTISLGGNFQTRTGTYVMDAQFKQLLAQTFAAASFATAQPDQLSLEVMPARGNVSSMTITDAGLRQQFYNRIFALPRGTALPNCPSGQDKVQGIGRWYSLNFSQWSLPILSSVDAYEGSCHMLWLDAGQGMGSGLILQPDTAFWNLLHQTANT